MRHRLNLAVLAAVALASQATAQELAIDTQLSTITVHVGKAGLLSAAGHDHWISAPIAAGSLSEAPAPRISFTVQSAKMTVKPDPKVDAKTQAMIQKDMEDMTLETAKFAEIRFQSSRIVAAGEGQWKVEGQLTLHGVTKTVRLSAKRDANGYAAHTVLRQTEYGIKPITVGGGLVKVKDEVELDFVIVPRRP